MCPTDCLETSINEKFKSENYFYTSIGNSFNVDKMSMVHIKKLIIKHEIKNIDFVLSLDNSFISYVLNKRLNLQDKGLKKYQENINKKKIQAKIIDQKVNHQYLLLSYILNDKIKELKVKLADSIDSITINGKIYNKKLDDFTYIYSELINLEKHNMN